MYAWLCNGIKFTYLEVRYVGVLKLPFNFLCIRTFVQLSIHFAKNISTFVHRYLCTHIHPNIGLYLETNAKLIIWLCITLWLSPHHRHSGWYIRIPTHTHTYIYVFWWYTDVCMFVLVHVTVQSNVNQRKEETETSQIRQPSFKQHNRILFHKTNKCVHLFYANLR